MQRAGRQARQRRDDRLRAQPRQAIVQAGAVVVGADGLALDEQHRPGVQAFVHLHDGDAGLGVAGLDGALDGRGAAPARQERGVDVQAAEARRAQHLRGQEQAVGGHHHHVGARRPQPRLRVGIAQAARLLDRPAAFARQLLDRALLQGAAAAGRLVDAREHQHDAVAGGGDRLERKGGERRRAGEGDVERRGRGPRGSFTHAFRRRCARPSAAGCGCAIASGATGTARTPGRSGGRSRAARIPPAGRRPRG